MPIQVITPQSAAEQSVSAPTQNPAVDEQSTSETIHTESSPARDDAQREMSADDYESLEDFAQALIERKQQASTEEDGSQAEEDEQSAASTQHSAKDGVIRPDEEDPDDRENIDRESNEQPEIELHDEDVFSPRDLNERINANPQLKQALEGDPALRNAVFRNARLASEADKYKEIFPDVESAQYAAQSASTFRELDELFLNAATPQGTGKFLQKWAEMAMLADEAGRPILENGAPKLHPAFTSMLDNLRNNELNFLYQKAEKTGDQELMAALDVVRERSSPASRAQDNELPPHIRAAAEQIKAREAELNRRQLEQQYAEQSRFDRVVGDDATQKIDALIEPALNKAALSDFVRQTAREKIDSAIVESLGRNRFFQARMAELARYPLTPEARQQRVNVIMSHVQAIAGPIVRQVLRDASQPVMRAQEERKAKVDAQVARSRSEPKGATSASFTGKPLPPEQLFERIRNDYTTQHGEEPSVEKLIDLWKLAKRQR
ncbi:MAG TPA: hypothetical protein VKL99_03265 [Candidatus Angelobacter sp.]|nr:hypothetical protein [Candidatus Angelobacter sp.]